jgi:hypothetical protein
MSAASVRTSARRDNLPVFPIEAGNEGDCRFPDEVTTGARPLTNYEVRV